MTVRVIDGTPHVYVARVGLIPVRGASPLDAEALDHIVAFALLTGHKTTTAPGLEVVPDIPDVEEKRPIGFRPDPYPA
jgi:hypothetical protein